VILLFFWVLPVVAVLTGITLINLFTAPVLKEEKSSLTEYPQVSVLIPARNEAENIGLCLERVLAQDYPGFEVIVLDDHSTDATFSIVKEIQKKHNNLKLIPGKALPPGWRGKNWACHQLSKEAQGKYLLFLDADVHLEKGALKSAIARMQEKNPELITVFPEQEMKNPGERLTVPLMNWVLLSFLILKKVFTSPNPLLSAGNGQFMLFKKEVYEKMEGHAGVKNSVVEDVAFVRKAKKNGIPVLALLGGKLVKCRMYHSFAEGLRGLARSFHWGFPVADRLRIPLCLFLTLPFLLPFGLVFFYPWYGAVLGLIFLQRAALGYLTGHNGVFHFFLHPFQIMTLVWIFFYSSLIPKRGKMQWKGRTL
jgi:chlorobactene glucosyltransferase